MFELPADQRPIAPGAVWAPSPSMEIEQAMAEIGAAAGRGAGVPDDARTMLHQAARRAPLAPEPFVVEGTIALTEGRPAARPLFEAARRRDPRQSAARYFLAQLYLAQGRVADGLTEMSALATLVPSAVAQLGPALAEFARQPGAAPALRSTFARSPALESATLTALAANPANADLVRALAGPARRDPAAAPWQPTMIAALIDSGNTAKARQVWRVFSGEAAPGPIFHPDFSPSPAPAPFNLTLSSGPAGMVQPHRGAGLDVVYYGREDAILASQTLLLAPGAYLLSARNDPVDNAGALGWTLRCVPAGQTLGRVALAEDAPGEPSARLTVPANCLAQALELRGSVGELDQPVDLTIYSVRIVPAGAP